MEDKVLRCLRRLEAPCHVVTCVRKRVNASEKCIGVYFFLISLWVVGLRVVIFVVLGIIWYCFGVFVSCAEGFVQRVRLLGLVAVF
jgi:hypothetical protein